MEYTRITSRTNPIIKEVVKIRGGKAQRGRKIFLIEGPHLIYSALQAGVEIGEVFFTESYARQKKGQDILKLVAKKTRKFFCVTEHLLGQIVDTETPQGVAAIAIHTPLSLDQISPGSTPIMVVLDGVQDPGNVGTIIRTSDATGVNGVILLPGTCDPFMPKVIRATAGSVFNLPIVFSNTGPLLDWLKMKKISVVVTSVDAGETLFDTELTRPIAFVFGNEARGVGEQIRHAAEISLRIPMLGKAESLNVASAVAVCLYEAVRQRSEPA